MERHLAESFMQAALKEAAKASSKGEVPIGAVIVKNNEIIASAHNLVESQNDQTKHAEILAINKACLHLNNWRLSDCSIFVTLEPCPMCISAILLSRIKELYFGSKDPGLGAVGSLFDLTSLNEFGHHIKVFPELKKEECSLLLNNFFQNLRRGDREAEGA